MTFGKQQNTKYHEGHDQLHHFHGFGHKTAVDSMKPADHPAPVENTAAPPAASDKQPIAEMRFDRSWNKRNSPVSHLFEHSAAAPRAYSMMDGAPAVHPAAGPSIYALPFLHLSRYNGDEQYRQRVEHYVDIISADIHQKLDPRLLAEGTAEQIRTRIEDAIKAVLDFRKFPLTALELADIRTILETDILGLGPLEGLLPNDDISDIMVDGPNEVFVEINGKIHRTDVRFRSEQHLVEVCQRIVGRVGRHVDGSSPICDARLPDGSRVNVILPPLSLKGAALTIRKFKKERLTLDRLRGFGTLDQRTEQLLKILAACRINLLVTGGTGSGKTTLLNCLTAYISPMERIVTCEDTAELQLQQPQVVPLETRPASTEGVGLVTMRDLVRNCLRMRPDRIIVGEVRGPEAFDLLQAMNTGHDGSMGTFHANSPRDGLFRLENMVSMANLGIPVSAIREQIASSLEVIIHTQRLRDGSRKIINVCEVTGMENDVITMQNLMTYEVTGEDESGRVLGDFRCSQIFPHFREKVRHYNMESELLDVIGKGIV